jgi:hypothetical protein
MKSGFDLARQVTEFAGPHSLKSDYDGVLDGLTCPASCRPADPDHDN